MVARCQLLKEFSATDAKSIDGHEDVHEGTVQQFVNNSPTNIQVDWAGPSGKAAERHRYVANASDGVDPKSI